LSLLFKCLVEPISALGILTVVNVKRLEIYRFGDALVLCHSSVESKERRSVRLQIYATSHVPATSFPFGIGAWLRLSIPKVSISTSLRVLAGVHIVTRDAKAKAVFRFSLSLVILSSGYGIDMASAKSTPSNLCYPPPKRDQKKNPNALVRNFQAYENRKPRRHQTCRKGAMYQNIIIINKAARLSYTLTTLSLFILERTPTSGLIDRLKFIMS